MHLSIQYQGTESQLWRKATVIRLVSKHEERFWTVEKHLILSLDCLNYRHVSLHKQKKP